jgi:hypothetical protein
MHDKYRTTHGSCGQTCNHVLGIKQREITCRLASHRIGGRCIQNTQWLTYTITIDENECENDFEVGEILYLFRVWCESNKESTSNFNHKQVLDLVTYFYPEAEIESDKYIFKIRSSMWNKQQTVQSFIQSLSLNNITSYDAYLLYWEHCTEKKTQLVVSKSYFEKYFNEHFA